MLPADPTIDTARPIARPFAATLAQARAVGLALVVAVAFVPRLAGLGASGFSEDEITARVSDQSKSEQKTDSVRKRFAWCLDGRNIQEFQHFGSALFFQSNGFL